MITVLFRMRLKPGQEEAFRRVAADLTASTRAEDEGCLAYAFHRRVDDPQEAVLYEQWRDADALRAHVDRLQRVYGPPDESEPYPPAHHRRRLPKAFLDLFEETDAVRYEPLV
jgi:quinol monooxygenase YgiN